MYREILLFLLGASLISTACSSRSGSTDVPVDDDTEVYFSNNGISVNQLASVILRKYDQDGDSLLDVSRESFLRRQISSDEDGAVMKVESRGLLFYNADRAGNQDGVVTFVELYSFLNTYDEDGNAELTTDTPEWARFEENYEERSKYEAASKVE